MFKIPIFRFRENHKTSKFETTEKSNINDDDFSSIQRCYEMNSEPWDMIFESQEENDFFFENSNRLFYFIRSSINTLPYS